MFEPKLGAGRKVSFERDGLDASKACHISARRNARSRAAGNGSAGPEAGRGEVLLTGAALNACRSNKRSAESSVGAIQRFVAKPRTPLLISFGIFVTSGTFVTSWFAPTSWPE